MEHSYLKYFLSLHCAKYATTCLVLIIPEAPTVTDVGQHFMSVVLSVELGQLSYQFIAESANGSVFLVSVELLEQFIKNNN